MFSFLLGTSSAGAAASAPASPPAPRGSKIIKTETKIKKRNLNGNNLMKKWKPEIRNVKKHIYGTENRSFDVDFQFHFLFHFGFCFR